MSARIILCADDFSQNEAISRGILSLLDAERLSAVSCMTNSPRWHEDALSLVAHAHKVDIGLHFNLTHSFGAPTWSLSELMTGALRRKLPVEIIREKLRAQLDQFEAAMPRPPDFVDGHQHIHVFPGIRRIVYQELTQRYSGNLPYLRSVTPGFWNHDARIKAVVLRFLALKSDHDAKVAGFRLPSGFAGLYSLSAAADFGHHMRTWMHAARDHTLIMCHPGAPNEATNDPISTTRSQEFHYLSSRDFTRDILAADICLTRLPAPTH